jgi:hypothetical protein
MQILFEIVIVMVALLSGMVFTPVAVKRVHSARTPVSARGGKTSTSKASTGAATIGTGNAGGTLVHQRHGYRH